MSLATIRERPAPRLMEALAKRLSGVHDRLQDVSDQHQWLLIGATALVASVRAGEGMDEADGYARKRMLVPEGRDE